MLHALFLFGPASEGTVGRPRNRMKILPDWLKNGYLRLMEPVAALMVRSRVHPNTITIVGTVFMVAGGVLYGTGHIRTGGFLLGITALSDVLDGMWHGRATRLPYLAPSWIRPSIGGRKSPSMVHWSGYFWKTARIRACCSPLPPWPLL